MQYKHPGPSLTASAFLPCLEVPNFGLLVACVSVCTFNGADLSCTEASLLDTSFWPFQLPAQKLCRALSMRISAEPPCIFENPVDQGEKHLLGC